MRKRRPETHFSPLRLEELERRDLMAAPTIGSLVFDNPQPQSHESVQVQVVNAVDADNDPIIFQFAWLVNGQSVQTTTTASLTDSLDLSQPGHGDRGDLIQAIVTPMDPYESGTAVANSLFVVPTLGELYSDYFAAVALADEIFAQAANAAFEVERTTIASSDAEEAAAEDALWAAYQDAIATAESTCNGAYADAESAYAAAESQAVAAKQSRVAAAEDVNATATAAASAAYNQAVQAAEAIRLTAAQTAETAYNDTLAPYLAARDAAQVYLNDHPDDSGAQEALAQAEQALLDAQVQAAAVRDTVLANALAAKLQAVADADGVWQASLTEAGIALENELDAADEEHTNATYAAWVQEVTAFEGAEETLENAELAAQTTLDAAEQALEDQHDAIENSAEEQEENAEDSADTSWKASEQAAWSTCLQALAALPDAPAPGDRREPPGKDGTPLYAVTLEGTEFVALQATSVQEATNWDHWARPYSPFFAGGSLEAKYRAWMIAVQNGASAQSPVGREVATAFADLERRDPGDDIIPTANMRWRDFFPQEQYESFIARRVENANRMDIALLIQLENDWQEARRTVAGLTITSLIGHSLANRYWSRVPGVIDVAAGTGWQELATQQAYERFHALQAAISADPAQMNVLDIARLEATAREAPTSAIGTAAVQSLVRVIVLNQAQRAAAYDAVLGLIGVVSEGPLFASIKSEFDNSTDASARARLAGLALSGAPDAPDWFAAALDAITSTSRSGNAADAWALDALNEHLARLERKLDAEARAPRAVLANMSRVNVTVTRRQTNPNQPPTLDGSTSTPSPFEYNDGLEQLNKRDALTVLRNLHVAYATSILDVLDRFPNNSARSRILNTLEFVSGKLVEDGEMQAACDVLRQERDLYWAAEPTVFGQHVWSMVSRRAATYEQTAPRQVIEYAEWMRSGAQETLDYLDGPTTSLPAADRAYLQGLADEAKTQAALLRASASNTIKALSLGLVDEFHGLAINLLDRQFPGSYSRGGTVMTAGGAIAVDDGYVPGRGFEEANSELARLVARMKERIDNHEEPTLSGVITHVGAHIITPSSSDGTEATTPSPPPWPRLRSVPGIIPLLHAFGQISLGFSTGSDALVENNKGAVCQILVDARVNQADRYIQNFLRSQRSRTAQGIAANLLDQQAGQAFWADVRQGAINFAIREIPILLATTVLSCGTVSAAYATWRVVTGIRLGARVLMAAEMIASVPIASIVSGQPIDTSATGALRNAGMMVGTGIAGRVLGRVAGQAMAALRTQLPALFGTVGSRQGVWNLRPFQRGRVIEQRLGMNLPGNFPVIDRFENGIVTSIKSMDLATATYLNPARITSMGRKYVDAVARFRGRRWADVRVPAEGTQITGWALDLAVPPGASTAQQEALQALVAYGSQHGVTVRIVVIQ